jgi:transposase
LLERLSASRCSVVAMEATGVYWLPVWKVLSDGAFKLVLANAAHIKAVPGRKTDMNDSMWTADLAAYGLIKGSFVPDEQLHELRTLTRTRKQLTREQTRGRRMIEAMIAGQRDPRKLAALAHRGVKASSKQLYDALHGRLTEHHRFLLKLHLGQWDAIDAAIRIIDHEIEARVARLDRERPADKARFSDLIDLLDGIPGVNRL